MDERGVPDRTQIQKGSVQEVRAGVGDLQGIEKQCRNV